MTLHFNYNMIPVFVILGLAVLGLIVLWGLTLFRHRKFWYRFSRYGPVPDVPPAPTPMGDGKVVPVTREDYVVHVGSSRAPDNDDE
jgi:hypothetical protein